VACDCRFMCVSSFFERVSMAAKAHVRRMHVRLVALYL
jgi:hypothetical protein